MLRVNFSYCDSNNVRNRNGNGNDGDNFTNSDNSHNTIATPTVTINIYSKDGSFNYYTIAVAVLHHGFRRIC